MRSRGILTCPLLASLVFGALALPAAPAEAVEYRLQVLNLHDEGFAFYIDPSRRGDNGVLPRLEAAADRGEVPPGAILADRFLQAASPALVSAFDAVPVKPESVEAAGGRSWTEVRWEGEPGKRAVWVVEGHGVPRFQEVHYVGLKGSGPLRYAVLTNASSFGGRSMAVGFPTQLVVASNGGSLWRRWVSRYLDVGDGIGALVGVDGNPSSADTVYIVIEQTAEPRVFKAALAWRYRPKDFKESPSCGGLGC